MAKVDRYVTKWGFKLDCGHTVSPGQNYVVTKTFTCEQDAQRPIHATLAGIREVLEKGVVHLKRLEWDVRHMEQK